MLEGNWEYDDDDTVLIKYDNLVNMFSNDYVFSESEKLYITCDVARFGKDSTVIILWQGWYIKRIWTYEKNDLRFLREKLEKICRQFFVPRSMVLIDEMGLGGGLVDEMQGVKGFVGNSRPIEELYEDQQETRVFNYKNLRSQCFFRISKNINKNEVGVYSEIDKEYKTAIIEELEQIKVKDADKDKTLSIIGKDEIKANIGRSPDFADVISMRAYFIDQSYELAIEW